MLYLLLFLVSQMGIANFCVNWGEVVHSDGSPCRHLPPQCGFIAFEDIDTIITETSPKWSPREDPPIPGNGYYGFELGNFGSDLAGHSFTIIFTCNAENEQGMLCFNVKEKDIEKGNIHNPLTLSPFSNPGVPRNVTITKMGEKRILKWKAPVSGRYMIYRRDKLCKEGLFVKVGECEHDIFEDKPPPGRYVYTIIYMDRNGNMSAHSEEVFDHPLPPTGLYVEASDADILVSWEKVGGRFEVYRNGEYLAGVKDTFYTDHKVKYGESYLYTVSKVEGENRSEPSSEAGAIMVPGPTGLCATPLNSNCILSWGRSPYDNVAGYSVYRVGVTEPIAVVGDTSALDDRLTPGRYSYTVRCRDTNGYEGAPSKEVGIEIPQPSDGYTKYANIRVLAVIYSNTPGGSLKKKEVKKIERGIELARLFTWRNSSCRINYDVVYMEISDYRDEPFSGKDGHPWPDMIEPDLRAKGVLPGEYGGIFCGYVYPPGGSGTSYGAMKILGKSTYCLGPYPVRTGVRYPDASDTVYTPITWIFTHEFQHNLDLMYDMSGYPQMAHGDCPLELATPHGEHFDFQAYILKDFKDWDGIKSPWGKITETRDEDGDGLPDRDARVPMDEERFGSSPLEKDTDGDGLEDLREFTAGIYKGADPLNANTDGDGIPDGIDIYPLYAASDVIHKGTRTIDGEIEDGWGLVSDVLDFKNTDISADVYMNWDEDWLYIGFKLDRYSDIELCIDARHDGWWHSRDNYGLCFSPDSLFSVKILDCTDETRRYNQEMHPGEKHDYELWDNDPLYLKKWGRLVKESDAIFAGREDNGKYSIELAIPRNEATGLLTECGSTPACRIFFKNIERDKAKWATLFEQYSFVPLRIDY
ncbi:hypothetical protein CH333_08370 [candidate division WOR-3 bacterium JGI_Cruoil_03_44_89]|uniref:Fibronectin type-III domain-containing protein n=1 Tax=candidate division WOR-3 bacterium JGI_Cruoil_03_44_89 TaxID=1973748 RepID=A0A235BRF8_UNCW3|nr:MAG: hypothetical protein CH333_08370 [candidate division WOR-3 bacterium JGI_Cruoil_03_44_89]